VSGAGRSRIDAAAEAIAAQRASDGLVRPLEADWAPRDAAEGYAIQAALARRAGCWPPAGFKVGATAATMQLHLGIRSPAAAFLDRGSIHTSGHARSFSRLVNPGVEAEIALRLGADLAPGDHALERLAEAVADVLPAIEIVENRYPAGLAMGTPMLIADRFFHAAAVLGPPAAGWPASRLAGQDLARVAGRLVVDGVVVGEGKGEDLLGHPLAVLRWLAASPAAAVFGGLRAGQVVLCGSVTVPAWLTGPAEVEVVFDQLGSVTTRFLP